MIRLYWRRFRAHPVGKWGAGLLLFWILLALGADLLPISDPTSQNLLERLRPPSAAHLLGTDELGRDVLSRILYGSRISLQVAFLAVGLAAAIGIFLGLLAGFLGGRTDGLIMRLVDIWLCFPSFFLILMLIAFLGPNIWNVILAIGVTSWTGLCRLVRAEVLSLRTREFVLAARGLGLPLFHILRRHLLPNVLPTVFVWATLASATAVLAEAALSFLGLGVQPPNPSWGNLLTSGKDYIHIAWWLLLFPGLALLSAVLGLNFTGEALREATDPRALQT